ncbi:hypothetical protein EON83_18825 [bacterium]|nr:MAG: hypothetical protein EON83_18825 [bacterium]
MTKIVQISLILFSVVAFNHDLNSVALLLILVALYIGRKDLTKARAIQAKSRQQLEDKLYAREFYPMPSPEEEAEVQRIKRALKMYQPLRFSVNFKKKVHM